MPVTKPYTSRAAPSNPKSDGPQYPTTAASTLKNEVAGTVPPTCSPSS